MPPILRFPRLGKEKYRGVSERLIRRVVKRINRQYHKAHKDHEGDVVSVLGESIFSRPRAYVSSGIVPIDCVVCYGMGFPSGIVEIFGPEASGKTAVLEHTLAEAQRQRYYTGLIVAEYSLDYRRVKTVGLNEEQLIISDAETIEDVYEQIRDIVREIRKKDSETPIVFGWDSIAATPTRSEMAETADLEMSDMGKKALQMSKFFRRLVRFLFMNKVCLICINQTRVNLGQMWGNKEATSGGKALKFYAWVRCRIRQMKPIKGKGGNEIGFMCELKVVKNKIAPPFKVCKVPIFWSRGIDNPRAVWEYAIDLRVFKRKGSAHKFNGHLVTRRTFPKFYAHHKKEIDALIRKASAQSYEEEE